MENKIGIVTTLGPSFRKKVQCKILGELIQKSFPGIRFAAVGSPNDLRGLDKHGWQLIQSDDKDLQRGFESKLHIWRFSPFEHTIFLDTDILPIVRNQSVNIVFKELFNSDLPVSFYGYQIKDNTEMVYQGTRISDLKERGVDDLWLTYGGGHYHWKKGQESEKVFSLAQRISDENWTEISKSNFPALNKMVTPDEIVVGIALRKLYPDKRLPFESVITGPRQYRTGKHLNNRERVAFIHYFGNQESVNYCVRARRLGINANLLFQFLISFPISAMKKIRRS